MATVNVELKDLVKVLKGVNARGEWQAVVIAKGKQYEKMAVDVAIAEGCEVIDLTAVKAKAAK